VVRIGQADVEIVFVLLTCGIVFQLIVLTFLLLLPSNRQLNSLSLVSFYSAMTIELGFAELLCCDCERVFCNSLVFYVSAFYFILWAVVSAGYPAVLSSSHFERINDDDNRSDGIAKKFFIDAGNDSVPKVIINDTITEFPSAVR